METDERIQKLDQSHHSNKSMKLIKKKSDLSTNEG